MMRHKVKDRQMGHTLSVHSTGECPHYWVIDSASGPTSRGTCKRCGAQKEFFNSMAATIANRDILRLPRLSEVQVNDEKGTEGAE